MKHSALFSAVVLGLLASSSWGANFYMNQVGYDSAYAKNIVVEGAASLAGTSFSVTSSGTSVFTGTLSVAQNPTGWSTQNYFVADFSALKAPGTYSLKVTENSTAFTSPTFTIASKALAAGTLSSVLDYFKNDRADDADVWNADAAISFYGNYTKTHDVRGGWYDAAGDISKYLTHLSYANYLNPQQIPLTTWALAFTKEHIPTLLAAQGKANQVQQEALWGADFLTRMIDTAGYFYATVFDGWTGSLASREICAFTGSAGTLNSNYQAAFREGGGMAIAALARVASWGVGGDSTSASYLAAAKRGFTHLQAKQTIGGTCAYCDNGQENIIDDYTALMASNELFNTSKDTTYLAYARLRAAHLAGMLNSAGYFNSNVAGTRPFWHASDAGLPLVALTRYLEVETDTSKITAIKAAVTAHLSWLVQVTNKVANPFGYARQAFNSGSTYHEGFFIPHDNETGYWWQGENARLGSLAAASVYASRKLWYTVPDSVSKYAVSQLDWILGRNPYGLCFMSGKGTKNPEAYYSSNYHAGNLTGGISNGITGNATDGTGITWQTSASFSTGNEWNSWHWTEQWIPHATWYLMSLAVLQDEFPPQAPKPPVAVRGSVQMAQANEMHVRHHGNWMNVDFTSPLGEITTVRVVDLQGRVLVQTIAAQGAQNIQLNVPAAQGLLILQAGNMVQHINF